MNADEFVPSPHGQYDFGEITPVVAAAAGIAPGKIRLRIGDSTTGLTHIENTRGEMIRSQYGSIEQFILYVATNYDAIYSKTNSRTGQAYDVVINHPPDHANTSCKHRPPYPASSKRFQGRFLRRTFRHAYQRGSIQK